jgi:hypothetical protein
LSGAVAGDHQLPPERRRKRGDRLAEELQVVLCRVRPGRSRPHHPGQRLAQVVAFRQDRVVPESLEIRLCLLLVRAGGHDGGVQADAGDARELAVRDLDRRQLPAPGDDL